MIGVDGGSVGGCIWYDASVQLEKGGNQDVSAWYGKRKVQVGDGGANNGKAMEERTMVRRGRERLAGEMGG